MTTPAVVEDEHFEPIHHVFVPHRAGIPDLRKYVREMWRRRDFATEMSKSYMRGQHSMTFFGQAWLVINPLLLSLVYLFMVMILSQGKVGTEMSVPVYFAHLTCGLFMYNSIVQNGISQGANSVLSAGKLLMNTAFPRLLIPLSALRSAFYRFLPTFLVYIPIHLWAGLPISWTAVVIAPIFVLLIIAFTAGLAAFFATAQVYFRDTTAFLPYFLRIWLYVSPVLWTLSHLEKMAFFRNYGWLAKLNPLYYLFGGYSEALQQGVVPSLEIWLGSCAWALISCTVGFLFFVSRERDFPVRLG